MSFTKGNMVGFQTRFGDRWEGIRCGAKTRSGTVCQRPAYKRNGKCHLHGGASTGPKTLEGKARIAAAHWKHGRRSRAFTETRKRIWADLRAVEARMRADGFI